MTELYPRMCAWFLAVCWLHTEGPVYHILDFLLSLWMLKIIFHTETNQSEGGTWTRRYGTRNTENCQKLELGSNHTQEAREFSRN